MTGPKRPMSLLGPEGREQLQVLGRVGAVGFELVVASMLGFFGGRWADGELGTEPWLQWIGFVLGLAAGAKSLYVLARQAQTDTNDDRSP